MINSIHEMIKSLMSTIKSQKEDQPINLDLIESLSKIS